MEVVGNSGFVASPNHPDKYPKNVSCLWNITVEYGLALSATVLTLDMEKTADCHADFLQIRTSPYGQWKDNRRYCSGAPAAIFSESGWAQVLFVSDAKNEFSGFNLTWSAVERKLRKCEHNLKRLCHLSIINMIRIIPIIVITVVIKHHCHMIEE